MMIVDIMVIITMVSNWRTMIMVMIISPTVHADHVDNQLIVMIISIIVMINMTMMIVNIITMVSNMRNMIMVW